MTQASPDTAPITIDLWTDIVCPWCYVGEERLREAIRAEGLEDRVEITTHSFELDPNAPLNAGAETTVEHLTKKYGQSPEQVQQMEDRIKAMAEALDLPYSTDRSMANTRSIHRLVQAAAEHGVANELFQDLQRGYFSNEFNVFDEDAVVAAAVRVGVPEEQARAVLEDATLFEDAVENDIAQARQLGVTGVPFMVFNNKYAAPGAMEIDQYRGALRSLAAGEDA